MVVAAADAAVDAALAALPEETAVVDAAAEADETFAIISVFGIYIRTWANLPIERRCLIQYRRYRIRHQQWR